VSCSRFQRRAAKKHDDDPASWQKSAGAPVGEIAVLDFECYLEVLSLELSTEFSGLSDVAFPPTAWVYSNSEPTFKANKGNSKCSLKDITYVTDSGMLSRVYSDQQKSLNEDEKLYVSADFLHEQMQPCLDETTIRIPKRKTTSSKKAPAAE
jgi:hypothetical protein